MLRRTYRLCAVVCLDDVFAFTRRNARSLQEEFASLGGVAVAADVLEGVSGDL